VLDQNLAIRGEYAKHAALLAFVLAGDDLHRVVAPDVDPYMCRARYICHIHNLCLCLLRVQVSMFQSFNNQAPL
jgi:hypothetical protein